MTTPAGSRPARRRCIPVYAQLGGLELLEELGAGARSAGARWRWPRT